MAKMYKRFVSRKVYIPGYTLVLLLVVYSHDETQQQSIPKNLKYSKECRYWEKVAHFHVDRQVNKLSLYDGFQSTIGMHLSLMGDVSISGSWTYSEIWTQSVAVLCHDIRC